MANICCSIELEPRTLRHGQINHAREIAVDIVQKKEPDVASITFNEGLKPAAETKEAVAVVVVTEPNPPSTAAEELGREVVTGQIFMGTHCQCTAGVAMESPEECRPVKEPQSAPF